MATHQHDVLIVGAGPAGLTAATYLTRYRRDIAVVDAGQSRARWIPASHNCPGFPFDVGGDELLAKLCAQAAQYGVRIHTGTITTVRKHADAFIASGDQGQWHARYVILARGVVDVLPEVTGIEAAIQAGAVRLCAICDGYEARNERIGVYGPPADAIGHAVFLRTYSSQVSVLASDDTPVADGKRAEAEDAGVELLEGPVTWAVDQARCIATLPDGSRRMFDTLYPVLGSNAKTQLALRLGAQSDEYEELIVGRDQQTSVDGLYACGHMVSALNQISVTVGHAAVAATAVHDRLPPNTC